jgi:prepilin-type N-terminal cleavage/methylation domain-containing protein
MAATRNAKIIQRCGAFTLVELLVVVAVIGMIAALALPAIFSGRESARRAACVSNLRQVGTALFEYEATYRQLVSMRNGPLTNSNGLWLGARMSGLVPLAPFLEYNLTYLQVTQGFESSLPPRQTFAKDGEPWWVGGNYTPWRTQIPVLRCPSDPGRMSYAEWSSMGRTNYGFSMGDSQRGIEFNYWEAPERSVRGMFQQRYSMRLTDCTDGLGNTIALGEIATPASHQNNQRTRGASIRGYQATSIRERQPGRGLIPIDCWNTQIAGLYKQEINLIAKRGTHWGDGNPDSVGFNTILPPNGPSCVSSPNEGPGLHTASSYHQGGAHVMMFDSSIQFVSDGIDAGDLNAESPGVFYEDGASVYSPGWYSKSKYGVWGAMGSRNASD